MSNLRILKKPESKIINPIIFLVLIGIGSLISRLYFFSLEIPITDDALNYFFYAFEISISGHLPYTYSLANNGWSTFLSVFFSIFQTNDTYSLMQLQKIVSISLSILTIVPLYFLLKKFFSSSYALVGVIIFAFEPRLIQNSIFGITDPLYILLLTISFVLFLQTSKKSIYISFAIIGLATLVRSEGIFLFLAVSILFFIKENKLSQIPKYIPALVIFFLILTPMLLYQVEVQGKDGVFGRISGIAEISLQNPEEAGGHDGISLILNGLENFPKYLIWDLIPVFIFFVPIGVIFIFRKINFEKKFLIITTILIAIPAFYAYSLPLQDTRYFYYLYPLFCVISIFTVERLVRNIDYKNMFLILIVIGIIFSSTIFLTLKTDKSLEIEIYSVAEIIDKNTNGVNDFTKSKKYQEVLEIPSNRNDLEMMILETQNKQIPPRDFLKMKTNIIPISNEISIEEFIENGRVLGLSHLVVEKDNDRIKFIHDIFENESKYDFLIKEFDSSDHNFKYQVKIFKINYDILNLKS